MANEIALALIRQLLVAGVIDNTDVTAISDDLARNGHAGEALSVNVAYCEACSTLSDDASDGKGPRLRLV